MFAEHLLRRAGAMALLLLLAACDQGGHATGPTTGRNPELPPPGGGGLIPMVNFSTAVPWPANAAPHAPAGFEVTRYATGLDHPRWLYLLPNGDVLVAEAATIPRAPKSLTDRVQFWLERNDGVIEPSADRITLLRAGKDGIVQTHTTFLKGLHQPFGMLLLGNTFYVANTNGVWRYPYRAGETEIAETGRKILDLPEGGYNNHWTRNLAVNAAGTKLYVTVGSGSNIGENGTGNEYHRANIIEFNPDGTGARIFGWGMRNPNGIGWEPATGAMWTVVNERDMLGDDLVPDYLTRVRDGDFYGWPWSYWGKHPDPRVRPERPDLVAKAMTPDYALGSHVAPLGLAFYTAGAFPPHYRGGAFVGLHGSWNRSRFAGYKIVYIPFANGMPNGPPEDFLTGFMHDDKAGIAYGRPVGVIVDGTGALLVADDTGNTIWRVAAK